MLPPRIGRLYCELSDDDIRGQRQGSLINRRLSARLPRDTLEAMTCGEAGLTLTTVPACAQAFPFLVVGRPWLRGCRPSRFDLSNIRRGGMKSRLGTPGPSRECRF